MIKTYKEYQEFIELCRSQSIEIALLTIKYSDEKAEKIGVLILSQNDEDYDVFHHLAIEDEEEAECCTIVPSLFADMVTSNNFAGFHIEYINIIESVKQ